MKIYHFCNECVRKYNDASIVCANVKDVQAYILECSRGHKIALNANGFKYETLFDSGVNAFLDGYYAESILTITASVERFHEFAIKFICLTQKLEISDIESVFNFVSKQSERQLGAYTFLYFTHTGNKQDKFSEKMVQFRNNVIHKGYIPSYEETLKYIKYSYKYIFDNFMVLTSNNSSKITFEMGITELNRGAEKLKELIGERKISVWSGCNSIILTHLQKIESEDDFVFEHRLYILKKIRKMISLSDVKV